MHPDDDNALNTEERIWDLTMSVNVKGVWWGCKYAILAMRQNPVDESRGLRVGGSIINTASFVAILGAATPQLACEYPRTSVVWSLILCQTPRRRYICLQFAVSAILTPIRGSRSRNDSRTRHGACQGRHSSEFSLPVRPIHLPWIFSPQTNPFSAVL